MNNRFTTWWKQHYTYIVSGLIIVISLIVVLKIKDCWPFGGKPLMRGDFVGQTVPLITELKHKILSGESLVYTWDSGMGSNYLAAISYGLFSPFTILFFFIPDSFLVKAGSLIFLIVLLCMDGTMIYYLTHRPEHAIEQGNPVVMVLGLAYTMCAYMISFMDVWYYLSCAVFLPLVLLGLEQYVYQKKWKLYVVALFLAFLSNYYLTGLFCIFVILYYLTLQFQNFRHFIKTSLCVLGLSVASIMASAVILLPTVQQLRQTSVTSSPYHGGGWFLSAWDEIQFLFSFQQAGFIGTSADSYGDNQIYYGIFALLLTGFYFCIREIPLKERIKRLVLLILYFLAFDYSFLNYLFHLFHYPNYYPNRFSVFFTVLCIITAADAWYAIEQKKYKGVTFVKVLLYGFGSVAIVFLCYIFADRSHPQYAYYFTIGLFGIYSLGMLILPYLKKARYVIFGVAIAELSLNFIFMLLTKEIYFSDFMEKYALKQFMNDSQIEESNGFSRCSFGDIPPTYNQGLLCGYKDISQFSSSMTLANDFFYSVGLERTTNSLVGKGWNPAVNSMLNIEYQIVDWYDSYLGTSDFLYSDSIEIYHDFPMVYQKDNLTMYRNPTVLSLGYMVDPEVEELTFNEYPEDMDFYGKINRFVSAVGKCGDIFTESQVTIGAVESDDCAAAIVGNQWIIGENEEGLANSGLKMEKVDIFSEANLVNPYGDPYLFVTYIMPEDGYYYVETSSLLTPIGYANAGEPIKVYLHLKRTQLQPEGIAYGWLSVYKFQEDEWRKAYEYLSAHQMEVEQYDSTHVYGTIDAGDGGLMFTSIPYDQNWHVYVDGEETELVSLWDGTFNAVRLEPGEHTIRFVYRQKWLLLGAIISIAMLGLFTSGCIHDARSKKSA